MNLVVARITDNGYVFPVESFLPIVSNFYLVVNYIAWITTVGTDIEVFLKDSNPELLPGIRPVECSPLGVSCTPVINPVSVLPVLFAILLFPGN